MDPRTPVIIGAAQVNDRSKQAEPIAMMVESVEAALDDAGGDVRSRIDSVRVPWGVWPYEDPGRLVAGQLGLGDVRTTKTTVGGNMVYDLLTDTASRIADGDIEAAVICGAETLRTRRADHAAGRRSSYVDEADNASPDEVFGGDTPLETNAEREAGMTAVVNFYAMAENALRLRTGESVGDNRRRIADLWAVGSRVAANNPDAWLRDGATADDIATVSAANRPIAHPYPKLMTSNLNVDQAGALIVCAAEVAEAAGVPRDRWVFPWSGTGASDAGTPTNRWAFDESPAMRIAGRRALDLAGVNPNDAAVLDIYSCFPIAVQLGQRELGIDPGRDWTITGGLTFAAGPLNCYCLLPAVKAVDLLRETPGEFGFLTGNGGYFSKHSFVVLGGSPNAGFRTEPTQSLVDAEPSRPTPVDAGSAAPDGSTFETFTLTYDRNGSPEAAIVSSLSPSGERHLRRADVDEVPASAMA